MSTTAFATFGLGMPASALVMGLLNMIETSVKALFFVAMQQRRKPTSVFRTAENTTICIGMEQLKNMVPSEPTIHFKIA